MNNEPVAIVELGGEITWLTDVLPYKAKLYTHPHPDNLGLALSIIDQQKLEIKALKLGDIQGKHAFDLAKIEIADLKAEIEVLKANPVKELTELTDGELEAIRKKAWKLADDATGNCISYSLEFQIIYDREFARAILRKAQEK